MKIRNIAPYVVSLDLTAADCAALSLACEELELEDCPNPNGLAVGLDSLVSSLGAGLKACAVAALSLYTMPGNFDELLEEAEGHNVGNVVYLQLARQRRDCWERWAQEFDFDLPGDDGDQEVGRPD